MEKIKSKIQKKEERQKSGNKTYLFLFGVVIISTHTHTREHRVFISKILLCQRTYLGMS